MRAAIRSSVVAGFVFACVLALGWASPLATLVRLAATTALIMGGTQHPLVDPANRLPDFDGKPNYGFAEGGLAGVGGLPAGYAGAALNTYLIPAGPAGEGYNVLATWTPEEFWPVFGTHSFNTSVQTGKANLDGCLTGADCIAHYYPGGAGGGVDGFAVFAYSQSARVASLEKAKLIAEYDADAPDTPTPVAFTMIGNPNRPNGGVLQRFKGLYIPILDVSFDGSSPTNSPVVDGKYLYPTVDITRQYDGWSDFPTYPINLLATINAGLGILFLHGDYFTGNASNPVAGQPYLDQGQYGDTNYYMIPSRRLPLLLPLAAIGVPDPILAALDAPLRVMVELGYERGISPGVPTGARLFNIGNIVKEFFDVVAATFTGLDDMISGFAHDPALRPFRTTPVESPFGVGGVVLPKVTHAVPPLSPAADPQPAAIAPPSVVASPKPAAAAPEPEPVVLKKSTAGHAALTGDAPAATEDTTETADPAPADQPRKRPDVSRPHRSEAPRAATDSTVDTPRTAGPRNRIKHSAAAERSDSAQAPAESAAASGD